MPRDATIFTARISNECSRERLRKNETEREKEREREKKKTRRVILCSKETIENCERKTSSSMIFDGTQAIITFE